MINSTQIPSRLEHRRRELGMTFPALAERSGVSEPTVKRILGGKASEASFANVEAVAAALGMSIQFGQVDADQFRNAQARQKAESIARLVQGTSALEGQAVDSRSYRNLVDRTYHELLAGSPRKLWSS